MWTLVPLYPVTKIPLAVVTGHSTVTIILHLESVKFFLGLCEDWVCNPFLDCSFVSAFTNWTHISFQSRESVEKFALIFLLHRGYVKSELSRLALSTSVGCCGTRRVLSLWQPKSLCDNSKQSNSWTLRRFVRKIWDCETKFFTHDVVDIF